MRRDKNLAISLRKQGKSYNQIAKILKAPFLKSYSRLTPSSKQKRPPNTLPYGTLRIWIYDAKITNKVKGWIQGISEGA